MSLAGAVSHVRDVIAVKKIKPNYVMDDVIAYVLLNKKLKQIYRKHFTFKLFIIDWFFDLLILLLTQHKGLYSNYQAFDLTLCLEWGFSLHQKVAK